MSNLGCELHVVVQQLVANELASLKSELTKRFYYLEQKLNTELEDQRRSSQQLLAQVRRREERADYVQARPHGGDPGDGGSLQGKVCIEVGAEKFFTTAEVLSGKGHPDASARDSYFTALLSGRWCSSLFIARSPESFRYILEYLTYHSLHSYPKDATTLTLLAQDADFYGLRELHGRLSTSISRWAGVGSTGGVWHWRRRCHTAHTAHHATDDSSSRIIVQRGGAYLVCVRDTQEPLDGQRKLELHSGGAERARSFSYTADGPVCTQIVQLMALRAGEDISVHSDAPVVEDHCSSLSMVLLNDNFTWGTWRGFGYSKGWQWQGAQGLLSNLKTDGQEIVIDQNGHYLVAACDMQEANGEKMLRVSIDGRVVASSFCNTGCDGRNSRSMAFLVQLLELSPGQRLKVVSDAPVQDEPASLSVLRLPGVASCSSWQATGQMDCMLKWGLRQIQSGEFSTVSNDTHVQVARDGVYLVTVRAVHGGNSRKVLDARVRHSLATHRRTLYRPVLAVIQTVIGLHFGQPPVHACKVWLPAIVTIGGMPAYSRSRVWQGIAPSRQR